MIVFKGIFFNIDYFKLFYIPKQLKKIFMILVTGGTGLVGSHLLYHLLKDGEKIRAIYRPESNLEKVKRVFAYYSPEFEVLFKKIEWVIASLNNIPELEQAFQGIKKVYHCAAVVSFDAKDYHLMRKVNIEGTENMVNLSILNNIDKFCFVSSIASLGKSVNGKVITENDYWTNSSGKSGYAITKQGAESEVWRASQEGLNVVIVNPGVILGSGFWNKGSGRLFNRIYHGFKFYTEGVTGFVGVKDVVQIMISLMQNDITNERFILVSENASFKDIFFKIADAFEVRRPRKNVSPFLSEIAWKLDWLKGKLFNDPRELTKYAARAGQQKKYYSSEKIKKRLTYDFETLDQTIGEICKNYLQDFS